MELHSTRPDACVGRGMDRMQSSMNNSTHRRPSLFIAESVNRIELGCTGSRIKPGSETHKHRKHKRSQHQPPRHRRKFNRIEILAMQINVRAVSDGATEQPAKSYAKYSAQQAHDPGFDKEKPLHVGIAGAQSFQHADLAAPLENGHN